MPRKKKNTGDRVQTTARIPKELHKVIAKAVIDAEIDQIDAINEGLLLWLAHQKADGRLRVQFDEATRPFRHLMSPALKPRLEVGGGPGKSET